MELQEIKQNLIETRVELFGILNGLTGEQLNKRKDESSWSIAQVCQHLSKTEELYVLAIRTGLQSNEESLVGNKSLDFLLDRSQKIDAPEIAKPTDEYLQYQAIIERLNHSRQQLLELLNTIEDPSVLSKRHFKHPVFKEMLLIEWVQSIYMHEQRHIKQIHEMIDGFK
ncbi:DinB family protein [Paenibacillus profundus]|uniref:DinB family protein n=1 Tax=Paenibacillus profundus TaxID=1173085 RepID=A0ABS8YLS6_9BACL|nr:DinB family protein [Paenibacillus profundus]MCE5172517.1 DinB family protein [Paenibacillus profundus]